MRLALVAITVALGACAAESPTRATPVATAEVPSSAEPARASASASASPSPSPSASASAPTSTSARPSSCADALPNADMLRDNIADTSVSGIAEVVAVTRTPTAASGYVNDHYDLRVVKWLSGTGSEKQTLTQGVEAASAPVAAGTLLFFSACSTKDGAMSEPDVGYVFPVAASCRADAEKIGEAAAKRAHAIGKRKKACAKTK